MLSLDYFLIGAGLLGLFFGYQKGLISQFASLFGYGVGAWAVIKYSDDFAAPIQQTLGMQDGLGLKVVTMAFLFVGVIILVRIMLSLLEKGLDAAYLGTVNRIAGAALGLVKYVVVFGFISLWLHKANSLFHVVDDSYFMNSTFYQAIKNVISPAS